MKPAPITLHPAPVHVAQYRNSPHAYGIEFTTKAKTTRGIARAAARAAREDLAYWLNRNDAAPVMTSIDFVALLPRDWHDSEMQELVEMIDRETSKPRPPRMHESAGHPTRYTDNFLA